MVHFNLFRRYISFSREGLFLHQRVLGCRFGNARCRFVVSFFCVTGQDCQDCQDCLMALLRCNGATELFEDSRRWAKVIQKTLEIHGNTVLFAMLKWLCGWWWVFSAGEDSFEVTRAILVSTSGQLRLKLGWHSTFLAMWARFTSTVGLHVHVGSAPVSLDPKWSDLGASWAQWGSIRARLWW